MCGKNENKRMKQALDLCTLPRVFFLFFFLSLFSFENFSPRNMMFLLNVCKGQLGLARTLGE